MPLRFFADVHVPRAIVQGLRLRDVDVLTAMDDGHETLGDELLLERAGQLGRVLVTSDHHFLAIADAWEATGRQFAGITFVHPLRVPIGVAVKDMELIAKAGAQEDLQNRVLYLPLRGAPQV